MKLRRYYQKKFLKMLRRVNNAAILVFIGENTDPQSIYAEIRLVFMKSLQIRRGCLCLLHAPAYMLIMSKLWWLVENIICDIRQYLRIQQKTMQIRRELCAA